MVDQFDTRCGECNGIFPREEATTDSGRELVCPVCGGGPVMGVPYGHHDVVGSVNTRCDNCGSSFPRSEAMTEIKGVLACPVCGSTSDLGLIEE